MSNRTLPGLLAGLLSLSATSCDRSAKHASADPEWIRLEGTRQELIHKIGVAEIRVARLERQQAKADPAALELPAQLSARLIDLNEKHRKLSAEISDLESSIAMEHRQHLESVRSLAVGTEFQKLDTRTGNSYQDVKVVAVDDTGVKISHSAGISRLGSEDLDPSLCEKFGIDKDLELAANQKVQQRQQAYFQQVARDAAANDASTLADTTRANLEPIPTQAATNLNPLGHATLGTNPAQPYSGTYSYYYRTRPTIYYYPPTSYYSGYNCYQSSYNRGYVPAGPRPTTGQSSTPAIRPYSTTP